MIKINVFANNIISPNIINPGVFIITSNKVDAKTIKFLKTFALKACRLNIY